jgi:hypothetical protein
MGAAKEIRWPEKNFGSHQDYQAGNGDKCLIAHIPPEKSQKFQSIWTCCQQGEKKENTWT